MGQATETKHTPGPWAWDESWGAVVSVGDTTRIICPMWTGCNRATMSEADTAIDQANARIIALSPELADFARECARADSDCGDALRERARVIVAAMDTGNKS